MLVHLFSDKSFEEDKDAIPMALDLIADTFGFKAAMVGVFKGVGSDSLVEGYRQNVIDIAEDIQEQFHLILGAHPPVENISDFIREFHSIMTTKEAQLATLVELDKPNLTELMGREITDGEAVMITLFLIGDQVVEGDFCEGTITDEDSSKHYTMIRYRKFLTASPAYVASTMLDQQKPVKPTFH